jgi:membrane associated rhomboid family serine protease
LKKTVPLEDPKTEKLKIYRSIWFPMLFTLILWLVKGFELIFNISFAEYGLVPLSFSGLRGIIFMPFIHGNFEHLFNNSLPIFFLSWALFYFYRSIAFRVFFLSYFIHGFWLWFFGRESYHVGASGIIYSLSAFIFVSGIIRKNTHLLSISLIVAFLYGSMVWGIFPMAENISWEAHLTGMLAGIVLAFFYKEYGPPPNIRQWKNAPPIEEEEEDADDSNAYWNSEEFTEEKK